MLRVWQVTKYDPADRDERGSYVGGEDVDSDHGPVEAAYLDAVAAFAAGTGVDHLQIREPSVISAVGLDPPRPAGALSALFGADLDGYHDGAQVRLDQGLELVRSMLRGDGGWCRLESGEDFFVDVGRDQYVYVGSSADCRRAVSITEAHGSFPEPIDDRPYEPEVAADVRPVDAAFRADLVDQRGAVLLEEGHLHNAARWHRLTAVRDSLTPRARRLIWPDLNPVLNPVLATLPDEGLGELVWQNHTGRLTVHLIDESNHPALSAHLANAQAATYLPAYDDDRHPLLTAVLPDPDGVLRARWTP
ncbi:hypothetical protein ACWKSP_13380 [Micromonosporaceae bacterium Da 78-11]